jgi:N-methylhydantoinase A
VTDANLVLGRVDPSAEFGGSVRLDHSAALGVLGRIGESLDLTAERVALGIAEVVESHMHRAIRKVSVEEGADPRRAALVAFGGAGGLHATALARRLDMSGVVVPPFAGVFSALGLLLAPPRADAARSVLIAPGDSATLDEEAGRVGADALDALREPGSPTVSIIADVRYLGQSHETSVPYALGEGWAVLAERFHDAHRRRNGFDRPEDPIEVVTIRAEAVGRPALSWDQLPGPVPTGDARRANRPVLTAAGVVDADVWWRPGLSPGTEVAGPAVIEEPEATTYLGPGEKAAVHETGALEVTW